MIDIFTMPDGRKIEINWGDINSITSLSKADAAIISRKLSEALAVVQAPDYCDRLAASMGFNKDNFVYEGRGCFTIYRT